MNSFVEAARPGQYGILWGTGLGAVSGNEASGPLPGDLAGIPVEVYVGGKSATLAYRGRSGCCAGVDQVVFIVPGGAEGCFVPIAVHAGGVTSNVGSIAITSEGKVCSDPAWFSSADLSKVANPQASFSLGETYLARLQANLDFPGVGRAEGVYDFSVGLFSRRNSVDFLASSRGSQGGLWDIAGGIPSVGCTIRQFRYVSLVRSILPGVDDDLTPFTGVNAGAGLNITGSIGTRTLLRVGPGDYVGDPLGGSFSGTISGWPPTGPPFLEPGRFNVSNGTGGPDAGAFDAGITIPSAAVSWSNQGSLSSISRTQDLTVTFSGGDANANVVVWGTAADPATAAGTEFVCVARANVGSLTVPAWVLAALPASGLSLERAFVGFLGLAATAAQPTRFSSSGLDQGFFNWFAGTAKNVVFQ